MTAPRQSNSALTNLLHAHRRTRPTGVWSMRFINIPAFSEGTEITDLTSFYKSRLAGGRSAPCKGGILLLGYMVWPNDTIKRENAVAVIQEWLHHGEPGPLPLGLRTAQQHWARVADIIHLHHDIATGGHQEIR